MKAKVITGLMASLMDILMDILIDTIAEYDNLGLAWEALQATFQSGRETETNMLSWQLHSINMKEWDNMEEYVWKARELKNTHARRTSTYKDTNQLDDQWTAVELSASDSKHHLWQQYALA